MSQHDDHFDEFLRRVLHEEANAVEPGDDGLERIRARLTRPRPVPVAWVMAVASGTGRRVQGAWGSASAWLRTLPGGAPAPPRSAPDGQPRRWRSPVVLAAAGAVVVVVGILAFTPLPQQAASATAALFRSIGGAHGSGPGGHGGQAEGSSTGQPSSGAPSSSPPGKRAAASPSPSATRSRPASPAPASPSATVSPTPSPTPTPSSSPCPSPSPTPTPTSSPSTGSTACPTPTVSPSGSPASPTPTPGPGA